MSEGGGDEEEPKRLSQIFEPLVDFHSKASLYHRSSSSSSTTTSSGTTPAKVASARDYAIPATSKLLPASAVQLQTRSTPNSPRLLAKRHQQRPAVPKKPNAAYIASPSLVMFDPSPSAWTPFSGLTENLDVRQLNNYQEDFPEINWQERCLELQLELHRSRNQVGKVRDMMKEKLQELERRVVEAEQRAEDAQKQVRVMEQKLCDWPTYENCPSRADTDSEKTISQLEHQVEEQKQLRLQDAKQVEAKAAKIKEWVTNKLRDLEEQNQVLREQNIKCNQQLQILKDHIASQSSRSSLQQTQIRASLSLEVQDSQERRSRQRSDSLDSPGSRSLAPDLQKYYQQQKKNMEPQELARDLACAVEDLSVSPLGRRSPLEDVETAHDYAEIYTPSVEKTPAWLKSGTSGRSSTTTSESVHEFRPPTPPLHRFPSWEAKIYQLAREGITGTDSTDMQESESTMDTANTKPERTRSQVTSVGYCDINVPVYATVKGRASQIRSVPFSGDSSDSSDGEENAAILTYNATSNHNSSSTENTESSASASSPSKHGAKLHQSPAKKAPGSESPKAKLKIERTPLLTEDSALSDDYAIPPDAMSVAEQSLVETLPSLLMRSSYVDSPNKKIDTLEKSGHLHRLGGKLKTWRKRYFLLKNGNLTYWKSQHDINRKPQGQIFLDDNCRISRADGASTFEIDTGKKVFYLAAESTASVDDWVKTLQNVQRRNAAKLLLSRDDQKPTVQGWVTKVKNGHAKKCWCVLIGKMFMYFKGPGEASPIGQINMREARVEEVEHVSDSDSEEREESQNQAKLTVSIYPQHQGPSYLILPNKQERDNWLYHLTVVSGGARNSGTQYEQLIQKLMEIDGDAASVIWRHPILLHTKDPLTSSLTSLENETLQAEALKLFKSCQLFMSVAVNQPAIDYHVVLAQNALQLCLDTPKLQSELICGLIKQTSPHLSQKLSAGVQVKTKRSSIIPPIDCKSNPPPYSFIQGWQLLALAVSLFVPKNNRLLWYLKIHLSRHSDSKTENGKYAIYCERALERTMQNGDREAKPSRMEVLSILLKNPYHHSLPHAIPVHFLNGTYQVVSFDGSTTIEEFQATLAQEIGCRDSNNGFAMFSDDPIERDLEHFLDPQAKVCDVISKWETALREKGSGKFENSRVIQLTYKNRLYWKGSTKLETDKERLLLVYQTNHQIVQGRFPLSKELALELASLMAQIDMGDFTVEKLKNSSLQALDKFYPYRYRDAVSSEALKDLQDLLSTKWALLKGKSVVDCVRIYLTCTRKWPFFGAILFQAQPRNSDQAMIWLAVCEDALSVLELSSMTPIARYAYTNIMTFGGCQDDFMVVIGSDEVPDMEQKLLFALSKPKILELTLLIADFMNALGHTLPGTPKTNTLTRNNSHRSIRSRLPHTIGSMSGGTLPNDTLNSATTYTLNSHSHTFNSQSSMPMNVQPDILKSLTNTPDHHNKTKKN